MTPFRLSIAVLSLAVAAPALAAPTLVSSTPAAAATAPRTARLELRFDRKLDLKRSRVSLVMTSMPGMADHGEMRMTAVDTSLAKDGMTLVTVAKSPFPAGSYRLDYSVTGADASAAKGKLTFTLQ